jgi:hypothetical protein
MSDSLIISNQVELLGGGVASVNPICAGAVFRLQPGYSLGAPEPTTDFVASLILDGERPFGRRASNRTIQLPIWITAPTRQLLAAAREVLEQAIDQDIWTMTWTRDPLGGTPLPLIIDCFRAQATVPTYQTLIEKELTGLQVTLTIPALPYGRSDVQTQVSFAAPVPTTPPPPPPPVPVVLDSFSQISSPQCSQSSQCVVGPWAACWDPDSFGDQGGQQTPLTYSGTFVTPLDLSQMQSLQMWLGFGSRYYTCLEYHGKIHGVQVYITLTDTSGNTLGISRSNLKLPVSPVAQQPVFSRVTMRIPQGSAVFDYDSVASYSVEIINRHDRIRRLSWVTAYLDALTAYPGAITVQPVTRGALHTLYGLAGTARAPASLSFQQAPTAGTPTTITAAGAGTYTVPANTAWLKAECTGGGGAGAGMTPAGVGAGGNGAEYAAEFIFAATPGQVIPYIVGAGDTPGASPAGGLATVFGPVSGGTMQVIANGGGSVPTGSDTVAAILGVSSNSVEHPGGLGRANPAGTFGGGGGSAGGSTSAGQTPMGSGSVLYATPGTYSGSGSGWLCPGGVFQVLAEVWAGGGSGAGGEWGPYGSGGSGGQYRNAYINTTPGTYYTLVVGSGGAAVTSGTGHPGTLSSFTGDTTAVSSAPGAGGLLNWNSYGPGGGSGGSGSGAVHNGGAGGPGYPYTGGGGSGGGPGSAGNQGYSNGGAIAPSGGGNGGNGSGPQAGAGSAGQAPGGAGGGSYASGSASGAGAAGQVRLTYPATTGAPTSAGGTAVTGGGAGGPGGATAGSAGSGGLGPGGGGGGAYSSGSTVAGGTGATGQIKVTPYSSQAFKTLIAHRPPPGALKTFQPLVSVGGGNDAPDGTHAYQMPQPLTGINADFGGTYTVYLIAAQWPWAGTSARTIVVTVTQYEYAGGASYPVSTLPVTVTPQQVTNGIVTAGVLTLPLKLVAPDNTGGYYTVSVTDTIPTDRFYDCIFLDTMGQSLIIGATPSAAASTGYVTYYADAPDPNLGLGSILGSQAGRADAISVMDGAIISGPAMAVEPADGDNALFTYSADGAGAPSVSLAYHAAYFFDRFQ